MSFTPSSSHETAPVGVISAGAWGTALAQTIALAGNKVIMWDRTPSVVGDLTKRHENRRRYPGVRLEGTIEATSDLAHVLKLCNMLVVASPSHAHEDLARDVASMLESRHVLVMTSKGFRERDGALLTDVWREVYSGLPVAVVTGPSFASELIERKLTAFIVASEEVTIRTRVADLFNVPFVRVYESDDIVGAQLAGALKNVLAIAAGIIDGLQLGNNPRAAVLARGLAEMVRYAQMRGGKEKTIWGLAGMGDVILTATSPLSRNFRFGQLVGRGMPLEAAHEKIGTVEGINTARIVTEHALAQGVDLAIISAVDGVLNGDVTPLRVIEYLMQRPRSEEFHQ